MNLDDKLQAHLELKISNQVKKLQEAQRVIAKQKEKLTELNSAIMRKNIIHSALQAQYDFLTSRIVTVHGKKVFMDLLAHVDNPAPFNIEKFRNTNQGVL
jgi:uncharacterized coiled-coil protein SlyX